MRFDWSITNVVSMQRFVSLCSLRDGASLYRDWLNGEFDPSFEYEPHPWLGFNDDCLYDDDFEPE